VTVRTVRFGGFDTLRVCLPLERVAGLPLERGCGLVFAVSVFFVVPEVGAVAAAAVAAVALRAAARRALARCGRVRGRLDRTPFCSAGARELLSLEALMCTSLLNAVVQAQPKTP
jgi:hypothetical protein